MGNAGVLRRSRLAHLVTDWMGEVVIVVGSGCGLGEGYTIAMGRENCDIVSNDIDDNANTIVEEIREGSVSVSYLDVEVRELRLRSYQRN